ncbi:hypothetical protein EDB84DRAFT_1442605 [Lactarius hengduanensis]|nr:hypothetical protein EDB84DRAFT_1442605 [Lactarius hengduanensis]
MCMVCGVSSWVGTLRSVTRSAAWSSVRVDMLSASLRSAGSDDGIGAVAVGGSSDEVRLQPVVVSRDWLENVVRSQRLQPHVAVLGPNRNRKSGCLRLRSGPVAVFFHFRQLDLTTLQGPASKTISCRNQYRRWRRLGHERTKAEENSCTHSTASAASEDTPASSGCILIKAFMATLYLQEAIVKIEESGSKRTK